MPSHVCTGFTGLLCGVSRDMAADVDERGSRGETALLGAICGAGVATCGGGTCGGRTCCSCCSILTNGSGGTSAESDASRNKASACSLGMTMGGSGCGGFFSISDAASTSLETL